MALAVVPPLVETAVRLAPTASVMRGDGHTLVLLEGEHDIASVFALAESLAIAIALNDQDLVVDLSKVQFMGAETVGVLIRARNFLQAQSRSMTLQAPAPCAQRVLDLCEFSDSMGFEGADSAGGGRIVTQYEPVGGGGWRAGLTHSSAEGVISETV